MAPHNNFTISGDKFDDIQEKQSELEVRLAKLISSQSNGPLSRAEKEAGRELRTIDRQITQFKKSIQRAKNLSNMNPKTENSNLVQAQGQKRPFWLFHKT